jgi:hypothetical protein
MQATALCSSAKLSKTKPSGDQNWRCSAKDVCRILNGAKCFPHPRALVAMSSRRYHEMNIFTEETGSRKTTPDSPPHLEKILHDLQDRHARKEKDPGLIVLICSEDVGRGKIVKGI